VTWKRIRVTRISQEFEGEGQRLSISTGPPSSGRDAQFDEQREVSPWRRPDLQWPVGFANHGVIPVGFNKYIEVFSSP